MAETIALTGANLIAGQDAKSGRATIAGVSPVDGRALAPFFSEATTLELENAVGAATEAFAANRSKSGNDWAALLEGIAQAIEDLGDVLIERVMEETGLPEGRVRGERGRTMGQLRLFASVAREGSWVDARIETALPDRAPIPRPDIRSMLRPLGPVAVFGASNFPLAFSVAGGDTASALASGCPVVCKAHPAHPGTSELVGRAIQQAVRDEGFHPGTFSLIHGEGARVGMALVQSPGIKAVGFTGSLGAGRAIFDAAAARLEPIPVFAEMGSVNPVFVTSTALSARGSVIGEGLAGSVTLGSGQFCTNPGLVFVVEGEGLAEFEASLSGAIESSGPLTMLHKGIADGYEKGLSQAQGVSGISVCCQGGVSTGDGVAPEASSRPCILKTDAATFAAQPTLQHEVFGPASILVICESDDELAKMAGLLEGNLTGTLHMEPSDAANVSSLLAALEARVGRVIINSFPTGVEVCHAMHHGGPYPSTTAPSTTSVGTRAITRFARPVCYQGFQNDLLPAELQDSNPGGIQRMIDGTYTREPIA